MVAQRAMSAFVTPLTCPRASGPRQHPLGSRALAVPEKEEMTQISTEADESIAAPKGADPPDPVAFSLRTGCFQGTAGRGHDRRRRGGGQGSCPRCGSTCARP